MNEIVFRDSQSIDSSVFTTSKVIAEATGIEHRKIKAAIRKYKNDIDSFGLSTSYQAESSGGRPEEIVKLNEEQATFLLTLLKNTPVVVAFKKKLVHEFYRMKKYLLSCREAKERQKPVRRELTDAIKDSGGSQWDYKHYTDLAYKAVTGLSAAKLRESRDADKNANASNYMSLEEIEGVTKKSSQIAVLIDAGMVYQEIKEIMLRKQLRKEYKP